LLIRLLFLSDAGVKWGMPLLGDVDVARIHDLLVTQSLFVLSVCAFARRCCSRARCVVLHCINFRLRMSDPGQGCRARFKAGYWVKD
jgi:hypothetical protein